MAQDLLSAIGSRLEAQLKARDARLKTVEDTVKARVSMNPPAPFSLLPDGTKQFGYAPSIDSPIDTSDADADAAEAAAQTEDISDPGASFAALVNATVQIFTEANAEAKTAPTAPATVEAMAIAPSNQNPITLAGSPDPVDTPTVAQMLTPTVSTTTATEVTTTAASVSTTPVATTVAAASAAAASAAAVETPALANVASPSSTTATPSASEAAAVTARTATNASSGFVMLADGTKQFGYAPTGNTMGALASISKTPPVPADFGVGATLRRKGVGTDTPITVTRVGDGVVFANFTDSEGTREMAFYPNQMDLVTAAP